MSLYECYLDNDELNELDALLDELATLSVALVEGEYDSWEEAEATAAEVNDLIQRGEDVRALLFNEALIPEGLLLDLVSDLQLLAALADALRDLGFTGTYRLKRRAEHMIDILDNSCFMV